MDREDTVLAHANETQPETNATRKPLLKRRGLTIGVATGIVLLSIVFVILGLNTFKSSRNQAINVDLYPGAQLVETRKTAQYDVQVFSTDDSVQKVMDWFADKLPKDDTNGCKKVYTDAKPSEEPGHYYALCVVDNSLLEVTQRMSITINYQAATGSKDFKTYFLIERLWGAG
jgi:hypothetical protein